MATENNLEAPLLRVSRPISACQRCKNAKVKCDGKLPACSACERAGKSDECSSANDKFARGKERSYVASLETRIEKLERQIGQARAKKEFSSASPVPHAQSSMASGMEVTGRDSKLQRKEARDVNDLVSDFGFLSVNATTRDFHGFTEQMSFARLVLSTSAKKPMPDFPNNELPQRHNIKYLIDYYLEHIHILYPFLLETTILAAVNGAYQDNGRFLRPMDHWITRMVLAISLASLSRRRGDMHYQDAVRHAAAALGFMEAVVQPGSVPGIQAMLLLVLYSLVDPHHFNCWYLIGLASRALVDIGMHQDPPIEAKPSEPQLHLRKRLYISIYTLDRSISMVNRRGFSFTDDSACVSSLIPSQPQISIRNDHQPFFRNIENATHLNILRQIQSAAYQRLFQSNRPRMDEAWKSISSALHKMQTWFGQLPGHTDPSLRTLYRSDILFSSILILSPVGVEGTLCDYGKFLIFEYAIEYAAIMISVSENLKSAFFTFHDLLRASFVSERLIGIVSSDAALLFSGIVPMAPSDSIPMGGPTTIPAWTIGEMVNRAHQCLDQLGTCFEYLGPKYGYSAHLNEFKAHSRDTRQSLHEHYDSWTRNLGISRGHYMSSRLVTEVP